MMKIKLKNDNNKIILWHKGYSMGMWTFVILFIQIITGARVKETPPSSAIPNIIYVFIANEGGGAGVP